MYQVPHRKDLLTKLFKPLEHADDSLIYLEHIIFSSKEEKKMEGGNQISKKKHYFHI